MIAEMTRDNPAIQDTDEMTEVIAVTEVVTDISMSAESWLAAFLCELPQSGPGGEGIQMAAKVQVKKNKR